MIPLPPIYIAAPPEVHSTLLNFGGTAAGITLAGTSWTELAAQYQAAAAELSSTIGTVQASYQGPSSEQFVAAHQPYLGWLELAAVKAALAAQAHGDVVASYESAVAAMPTLGELITNHVVHGVLVGTNFFGCNTVPIGVNEGDYTRMWIQAANVMTGWDGASALAVDLIPPTSTSPVLLVPGVGESGNAAATAAGLATIAEAQGAGVMLNTADMLSTKLAAGKIATSPASAADGIPGSAHEEQASGHRDDLAQQLKPESMGSSLMSSMTSMGSPAAQAATSVTQGGPQQLASTAPQLLGSAPQTLGQLLTSFSGEGLAQNGSNAMPVGFAGTGAIRGANPAGLTSLAGGAFGSGSGRPMMPSTWGASPAAATENLGTARTLAPVAATLPGGSTTSSGAGAGGAMMGAGARNQRSSRSRPVTTYDSESAIDEDEDAETRGRSP